MTQGPGQIGHEVRSLSFKEVRQSQINLEETRGLGLGVLEPFGYYLAPALTSSLWETQNQRKAFAIPPNQTISEALSLNFYCRGSPSLIW